jgi:hypothetical protein
VSALIPLGPSLTGTLVAADIDVTVAAYCDFLHTTVLEDTLVCSVQAQLWGKPKLEGSRLVTLQSESGYPWLRVLSNPDAVPARPFLELGWLALEVLVSDVDHLAQRLAQSPFEIYRPPADLDVSDDIRAMQVIGPAGEVLYLTQVNGAVEPFDLPIARSYVDRLFIPVTSCLRRDEGLAVYNKLGAKRSWSFDTRISSVNKAHGLDASLKHPVATVQLANQCMVEIDQLGVAKSKPPSAGRLPAGIAMVSFVLDNIDNIGLKPVSPPQRLEGKLYGGQRVAVCRGAAGELIELIEAAA